MWARPRCFFSIVDACIFVEAVGVMVSVRVRVIAGRV